MVKMSRVCPKCGKDFSNNPYWSTDLPRHIERKNPCNRPADWKFVRATPGAAAPPPRSPLRCLDSVEWAEPVAPKPDLPMRLVAPWFFKQIVKDPANVCFVRPNRSKNEVWVKETKDAPVRIVRLDEFIRLFVNLVMHKHFPRDYEEYWKYDEWLFGENFINLDAEWDGSFPSDKHEFMNGMRDVLNEVLSTWPGKTPLKNMLLNFV
jgi:hypothetical protein